MKHNLQKTFFILIIFIFLTSCISPIYDGDMDISEQQSVWQYLKVYSIYEDRLPDKCGSRTPEELFDIINDMFRGGRYTEYRLDKTLNNAAAALENRDNECYNCVIFPITDSTVFIRIPEFSDASEQFFKRNVIPLAGYPNIVIDLMDNGGGFMSVCDYIIGEFLPFNSEYIQLEYREYDRIELKGRTVTWEKQRTANRNPKLLNKNIAILMDNYSASASEILISALKDKNDAHLIGRQTTGKGIGQLRIYRLGRKPLSITSIKIKGLTNRTGDYHNKGIEPDKHDDKIWEDAMEQYPRYRDMRLRYLYYAVMYLEPSADFEEVTGVIAEKHSDGLLYKSHSLNKAAPVGAYYILEDPLNN